MNASGCRIRLQESLSPSLYELVPSLVPTRAKAGTRSFYHANKICADIWGFLRGSFFPPSQTRCTNWKVKSNSRMYCFFFFSSKSKCVFPVSVSCFLRCAFTPAGHRGGAWGTSRWNSVLCSLRIVSKSNSSKYSGVRNLDLCRAVSSQPPTIRIMFCFFQKVSQMSSVLRVDLLKHYFL